MLRRTAVTLLLIFALANANQIMENVNFINQAVQGKGPLQARFLNANSDSLVADVPEKEPVKEQESSVSQVLRVVRSNVFQKTLNAAINGNQLDDQKVYEIPLTGKTVDLTFGKATPAETINLQVSFENDALFVYGKTGCATAGACRKDAPKATYTEVLANKQATTFNYMSDAVKGDDYKDTVSLNKDKSVDGILFGVATAGDKTKNVISTDGYLGLGFNVVSGKSYGAISSLLAAVAPARALTIWKKDDLSSGIINLGAVTYKSCPTKSSALQDALPNSAKIQQWWFAADNVEVDGLSAQKQTIRVNLDSDTIGLPKAMIDKINAKMTSNSIDDPSKLPKIKITFGKDTIQLDGSHFTVKKADKNYTSILEATDKQEYQVSLGNSILTKNCVVLKQKDDGKSYQIGLIYTESFSPSSMKFSVFSFIMLPLVYFMGL